MAKRGSRKGDKLQKGELLEIVLPRSLIKRGNVNIPKDLAEILRKASTEWKWNYAAAIVREIRALNLSTSYIDRQRKATHTSSAAAFPERHLVQSRERVKPLEVA
jgi:hypothetical protein